MRCFNNCKLQSNLRSQLIELEKGWWLKLWMSAREVVAVSEILAELIVSGVGNIGVDVLGGNLIRFSDKFRQRIVFVVYFVVMV